MDIIQFVMALFPLAILVQCGYALWFFVRSPKADQTHSTSPSPSERAGERSPVSIIICAKNEAVNLRKNLSGVLSQRYEAGYEVIVVNDASTDDTAAVLADLAQRYDQLRVVTVPVGEERVLLGKKHALSKGVAAAKHEWLVLTDADCVPASEEWLGLMAGAMVERGAEGERRAKKKKKIEIVLGYGGYNKAPGLLNAFIRWETMHTWLQYSSYARAGVPYMAVGRNMACTKHVLLQAKEHELWNTLPSGDDDMLVRIMGTADNVAVVGDASAHTHSAAKATWGEWVRQKQRHLSTGKYYKENTKWLLGGYAVSHAVVWLGFVPMLLLLLDFGAGWDLIVLCMAVRCLLYWGLWTVTAIRLKEKSGLLLLPLMDIGWLLYNFAFLPWITWKNKKQWT